MEDLRLHTERHKLWISKLHRTVKFPKFGACDPHDLRADVKIKTWFLHGLICHLSHQSNQKMYHQSVVPFGNTQVPWYISVSPRPAILSSPVSASKRFPWPWLNIFAPKTAVIWPSLAKKFPRSTDLGRNYGGFWQLHAVDASVVGAWLLDHDAVRSICNIEGHRCFLSFSSRKRRSDGRYPSCSPPSTWIL